MPLVTHGLGLSAQVPTEYVEQSIAVQLSDTVAVAGAVGAAQAVGGSVSPSAVSGVAIPTDSITGTVATTTLTGAFD